MKHSLGLFLFFGSLVTSSCIYASNITNDQKKHIEDIYEIMSKTDYYDDFKSGCQKSLSVSKSYMGDLDNENDDPWIYILNQFTYTDNRLTYDTNEITQHEYVLPFDDGFTSVEVYDENNVYVGELYCATIHD